MMQTYKELYFHLFNTLTDAITDLEQGQVLTAIHRMKLAQQAAEKTAEFVTLFYGEDVTDEQAQAAEDLFARYCPDAELAVIPGGQPVYYYIVSIE